MIYENLEKKDGFISNCCFRHLSGFVLDAEGSVRSIGQPQDNNGEAVPVLSPRPEGGAFVRMHSLVVMTQAEYASILAVPGVQAALDAFNARLIRDDTGCVVFHFKDLPAALQAKYISDKE